jgi:hypothetical protein
VVGGLAGAPSQPGSTLREPNITAMCLDSFKKPRGHSPSGLIIKHFRVIELSIVYHFFGMIVSRSEKDAAVYQI